MQHGKKVQTRILLALALLLIVPGLVSAETAISTSNGLTAGGGPLAIHGYDAVSYFKGRPERGAAKHQTLWNGAVYRFASNEHLRTFEADPEKYAPQFGGFCAYGVSVGKKFDGDPEVFRIVEGRLFFNLNPEIQATWEKDLKKNIRKAEKEWKSIRDRPAASL